MHFSIIISCTPLLARGQACKLSLTPLLSTLFFLHCRTDGWSNAASPTTSPYVYKVHLVKSTLKISVKCSHSLGFRYFLLAMHYLILLYYTTRFHCENFRHPFKCIIIIIIIITVFTHKICSVFKMFVMYPPCGKDTTPIFPRSPLVCFLPSSDSERFSKRS